MADVSSLFGVAPQGYTGAADLFGANNARPPFNPAPSYNTPLNQLDEMAFRQWTQDNGVPFNHAAPVTDYDLRGYWLAKQRGQPMATPTEINPNDNRPHFTDYYKTPMHQSFSRGSQWASPNAPDWINDHQLANESGRIIFDERR